MGEKAWPKPKIGISSCLLGNRVRHNGEHKRNDWMVDVLGPCVTWVPICPEVEMKLGVPRETMRLVDPIGGASENPKLVTVKTQVDLTQKANNTIDEILKKDFGFDCYVFKKDSPTCGLERVKIYGKSGIPAKNAVGLYAGKVKLLYPQIPMIEEGRLCDLKQRDAFLIQLFSWTEFKRLPIKINALQLYHQNFKLQFMAYDPQGYSLLGRIAANSNKEKPTEVFKQYESALAGLIKKPLTLSKNINAFEHMFGYFKKHLNSKEKAHILSLFQSYRRQKIPLVSLSTLFKYLVDQYSIDYLKSQSILEPYPNNLTLT